MNIVFSLINTTNAYWICKLWGAGLVEEKVATQKGRHLFQTKKS